MSDTGLPLELPHTAAGEIDWKTLGNILCAHILGEVHCASYVDKAYGQVQKGERNFEPDTDWKFVYKEDNVVAFQKSFEDSPINAFMGRGIIDRPMEDIVYFLETHERRKEWDRYLVEIRQVKTLSETDVILYMLLEAKNCLIRQQREFVQYERMTYIGDKYVRSAVSMEIPEIPIKPNVIRGELLPGTGWVLEPYNGSRGTTLVSFLAHVDLKGIPPIIVNRVMRRQPKAIHRIRKILTLSRKGSKKSLLVREDLSADSFTASEKQAVVAATMEYNSTQHGGNHSRYFEDDLPIDAFTGPSRLFSVPVELKYDRETDSYRNKASKNRSMSVDSSSTSSSFVRNDLGSTNAIGNGTTAQVGSSTSDGTTVAALAAQVDSNSTSISDGTTVAAQVDSNSTSTSDGTTVAAQVDSNSTSTSDGTTVAAQVDSNSTSISDGTTTVARPTLDIREKEREKPIMKFVELPINSNPVIDECTGYDGDTSPISFYTPQGSASSIDCEQASPDLHREGGN